YNNGTFTMEGGSIEGNTALSKGGGVCNYYDSTFTMNGGSIAGNTASSDGGGVYNSGTFTMEGGGLKDDIYRSDGTISINGGYFGTEAKDSIGASWIPEGFGFITNDGSDAMYPAADFPHKLTEPYVSVTKDGNTEYIHDVAQFTELNTDGATYKLLRNIELTSGLAVPADKTVTLDLNGFVLKGTGTGSVITNNGMLGIIDSKPSAEHKYTKGSDGLYTWDDANGIIVLAGGAITGGSGSFATNPTNPDYATNLAGGGVLNNSGATLYLGNVNIVGNTAEIGGGVGNFGTFEMAKLDGMDEGGKIVGNTAELGGGVCNCNTFVMTDGTIDNNTVSFMYGGGVLNYIDSTFTMAGGTISNNTAPQNGGGVLNVSEFILTGGRIENNTAGSGGGGVANIIVDGVDTSPSFNMTGGIIADNIVNNNSVSNNGDDIIFYGAFTMEGGGIKGEITSIDKGTITISGGYFGTEAKDSIDASWIPESFGFITNDGSDAMYPAADFPHKIDMVYVLVTEADGSTKSIGREGLQTFNALSTDGATYKLLRNVELVSAPLTVPDTATVT
ncbi:MAG: hypothetical protein J6Q42_04120, partial [Clostridia bacterium]|nr:hypothetical protein [Clostridia bacterium]